MSLFEICEKGDSKRLKTLLDQKCNINQVNAQGRTALHYCCNNTTIDCAQLLLKNESTKSSILNLQDNEGCSVLHLACMNGNAIMVKYLCEQGADVKLLDKESRSVIHWITVCEHLHLFDILIKYKAPMHTSDIHGAFPIHYASQLCGTSTNKDLKVNLGTGLAILQKFIDYKVDLDCTDGQQRTPLIWAASAGAIDELRLLYKYGADQLHLDSNSLSALHCATINNHVECIRMLVEHCRCPVEGMDINGWTPLFYAVSNNHSNLCQLLLDLKSNPNHKDKRGRTPSYYAIINGHLDCLKCLIKVNANIWIKNKRGDYPIHSAIGAIVTNKSHNKTMDYTQLFATIRYIFQIYPNKVNIHSDERRTPLHLAASYGEIEICQLLIECGAQINSLVQNIAGDYVTPYDLARSNQQDTCAEYLLYKHGGQAGKIIGNIYARRIQKCYQKYKVHKSKLINHQKKLSPKPKTDFLRKKYSCPFIPSTLPNPNFFKQVKSPLENKSPDESSDANVLISSSKNSDVDTQEDKDISERRRHFAKSRTAATVSINDNENAKIDSSNKIIIQTSNSVATYNKLYDRRKIIVEELQKLKKAKSSNEYIVINRSLYKILIENAFNPHNRPIEDIEQYLETLILTYDAELDAIRKRTNSQPSKQNRRTSLMF